MKVHKSVNDPREKKMRCAHTEMTLNEVLFVFGHLGGFHVLLEHFSNMENELMFMVGQTNRIREERLKSFVCFEVAHLEDSYEKFNKSINKWSLCELDLFSSHNSGIHH